MYKASLDEIKKLRDETLASIAHCKEALEQAAGNYAEALKLIQKRGQAKAADKASRSAEAGIIDSYIHNGKQVGVLLDLRCETDFVGRNDEFAKLSHDLCLQIAASSPRWISSQDVPQDMLEQKKTEWKQEFVSQGKKGDVVEKALEGKVKTFFKEMCLLEQPFIRDETKTVKDAIDVAVGKIGENIKIKAFTRYSI